MDPKKVPAGHKPDAELASVKPISLPAGSWKKKLSADAEEFIPKSLEAEKKKRGSSEAGDDSDEGKNEEILYGGSLEEKTTKENGEKAPEVPEKTPETEQVEDKEETKG